MAIKSNNLNKYLNIGVDVPIWKKLGYASEEQYLNATLKPQANRVTSVPTLDKYAALAANKGQPPTANQAFKNVFQAYFGNDGGATSNGTNGGKVPTSGNGTTPGLDKYKPSAGNTGGIYNGTSDFAEAYKLMYGSDYNGAPLTRKEGMTDGDWNALQALYKYYQQGQDDESKRADAMQSANDYYDNVLANLMKFYGNAQQGLDASKARSQQNASISLDKLMKYLPAQAQAQGTTGLGTASSAALQAYADYNNNMGNIANDYNAQMASLNQDAATKQLDIAGKRRGELADINDKYEAYARQREQYAGEDAQAAWDKYVAEIKAEKERQAAKEESESATDKGNAALVAQTTIGNMTENGQYDSALAYLKSNKSLFDEQTYNALLSGIELGKKEFDQLEQDVEKEEQKFQEEEQKQTDKAIITGQQPFEYEGGTYRLSTQLKSDANQIRRNNDFKRQLQEKCGTSDPYDTSKIANGTTFEIKADNKGSNDFNFWDDVGAFMLSPFGAGAYDSWFNWKTLYVTFYNGNWYLSNKEV